MRPGDHAAGRGPRPATLRTPSLPSYGYGVPVAQSLLEQIHEQVRRLAPLQRGAARGAAWLETPWGSSDSPTPARETGMADQDLRTYKLIELVGTSPTSYAEATKNAVERVGE